MATKSPTTLVDASKPANQLNDLLAQLQQELERANNNAVAAQQSATMTQGGINLLNWLAQRNAVLTFDKQ